MGLLGKPKGDEIKLSIEGMSCGHCVAHVTDALRKIPGVRKAEVNLGKKEATVIVEPGKATRAQLVKAVTDAGYRAA
jgi:copper chaperone CopZ